MRRLLAAHGVLGTVCFGGEGARTCADLLAYVEAIADRLPASHGRVVLACVDRYRFAAGLLAAFRRGHTVVLPPNGQPEAVRQLRTLVGAVELLHDRDEDVGLDLRALEPPSGTASALETAFEPAEYGARPALEVYTSGSTGTPTPHAKTMTQLLAEPSMWVEKFELAGRNVVSAVPPHHIYGLLFGVLVPLLGGGSMSRRTPVMPAEVLRELESAQAQVLVAVPAHLRALAAYRATPWPALEWVFSSAAPLPAATDEALAQRGVRVTQVLGSTETGGIGLRLGCHERWRPLPGVTLALDGDGCLQVASAWADGEAGASVPTADRVELGLDGSFVHLGRSDSVVKVGGRRVDLRELESRLLALPGVSDARVFEAGSPSLRGSELWAVVEVRESTGERPSVSAIKQSLSAHVDPIVMPRRVRVVSALPRTSAGKVTRADLMALFEVWRLAAEALPGGRLRVPIPAELGYFRGHFPGQPVLAGVVQLEQIALRQAKLRWPELGPLARVTRVKFKQLVTPSQDLFVSLARKGASQVVFEMGARARPGARPVSSGVLHFRVREPSQTGSQERSEGDS
jgi:4-coumarate--CoA ligase (photoactive yellow protein activation family)